MFSQKVPKNRVFLVRVMVIRDSKEYIRVLLYSYYTTITRWGVLSNYSTGFGEVYDDRVLGPFGSFTP